MRGDEVDSVIPKEARSAFGIATGAFLAEREDWGASITKAAADGYRILELTAITLERLETLGRFLKEPDTLLSLSSFDRVSIHAPGRAARGSQRDVLGTLTSLRTDFDIVLHPDVYVGEQAVSQLREQAVFENMDCQKDFGRDVRDLRAVFAEFPNAGFCLDVAHVWTNDPTLTLAYELIDRFGERLRQVHVSGIEEDGTHRSTTPQDLALYEPVLALCTHVPWLLETKLATDSEDRDHQASAA